MILIKYGRDNLQKEHFSDNFTHYFNDTFTDAKSVPSERKRRERREELETVHLSVFFGLPG